MAERVIRVRDLPGMREFLDSVAALLDVVNAERENVPAVVSSAADRVRAEALGIGNDPAVTVEDRPPGQAEMSLRNAAAVAAENPGRVVHVDWLPEP